MAPNKLILKFMCLHGKLFQSCLTLYDPMDCSLHGHSSSSVNGILQERMLEWVAIAFSAEPPEKPLKHSCSKEICHWFPRWC